MLEEIGIEKGKRARQGFKTTICFLYGVDVDVDVDVDVEDSPCLYNHFAIVESLAMI